MSRGFDGTGTGGSTTGKMVVNTIASGGAGIDTDGIGSQNGVNEPLSPTSSDGGQGGLSSSASSSSLHFAAELVMASQGPEARLGVDLQTELTRYYAVLQYGTVYFALLQHCTIK